jgi:hypothetical protein
MLNKRLQIALEFMIIFAFVLVVFLFLFALVASQRAQTSSSQIYSQEQLIAQSVAAQIDAALRAGNGYTARVPITGAIGTLPYQLLVTKSGGVIVNATAGNQALQAFAFSTARNVLSKSSYLQANTFYYNLPIANGTLVIQNSFGTICIDYACPNTSAQAANVTLAGQVAHAALLNGQSSYIDAGNSPLLNLVNSLTFSAWIEINSNTVLNNYPRIVSKGNGSPSLAVTGYEFWQATGTTAVCYTWGNGQTQTSGGIESVGCTPNLAMGKWYQIVGTYSWSGTQSSASFYLNGVSIGSMTASVQMSSPAAWNVIFGTGGWNGANAGGEGFFNGSMANVQIYNAVISPAQVSQLYQEGIGGQPVLPANIVGWWPLNGNANDYSGNGNNGIVNGPLLFPAVAELFAKVTNQAGYAMANDLVGFATTLGSFNANQMSANRVYANYTNANGIAIAFLNQQGNNGQALVKATAYNGNTSLSGNLVGWWPLNLGQGNTAYDISGNGNSGSMIGYAGWSNPNYVAGFDGNTSYIAPTNTALMQPGSITYSAWIYPTYAPASSSACSRVIQDGSDGGGGWEMDFDCLGGSAASTAATCAAHTANGWSSDANTPPLQLNKWYMVTCQYSSASGVVSTYVDGQLVASNTIGGGVITYGSAAVPYIGVDDAKRALQFFYGRIANAQVYNSLLTQAQILQLYKSGISGVPVTSGSVVGWWPLNGNANDYSGNGFNGTIYGNLNFIPSQASPGNNATSVLAASFNGVADVIVPPAVSLNATSISVSSWVNPYASGNQAIIAKSNTCSGGINNGWVLELINNNPSVWIYGVTSGWVSSTLAVPTNAISNVGFTYGSGQLAFYVNGQKSTATTATSNALPLNNANVLIGNQGACNLFHGNISNVQMYNNVLTSSQMQQIYSMGEAGVPLSNSSLVGWWPLDGNANDYSGHGNNGTATNVIYIPQSVTRPALPVSFGGTGTNFNGQSSEIATASNVNLPATTPETLVAWIYTASYPGPGTPAATNPSVGSVVLQEGTTNNANTYIINYTGHLGIDVWGCGTARSVGTVPLNAWVQVAYVYNALANSLAYYINGRPSGTVTPCGYHSTNSPLVLGYNNIGSSDNAFAGAMADVQLYNAAFSPSAIYQLYVSQSPPSASASIPQSWLP